MCAAFEEGVGVGGIGPRRASVDNQYDLLARGGVGAARDVEAVNAECGEGRLEPPFDLFGVDLDPARIDDVVRASEPSEMLCVEPLDAVVGGQVQEAAVGGMDREAPLLGLRGVWI